MWQRQRRKRSATAEAMAVIQAGNASRRPRVRRHQPTATSRPIVAQLSRAESRRHDWRCRAINLDLSWHATLAEDDAPADGDDVDEASPRGPDAEWLNGRLQLIAGFGAGGRCRSNDYCPPDDLWPSIIPDVMLSVSLSYLPHTSCFSTTHQNPEKFSYYDLRHNVE